MFGHIYDLATVSLYVKGEFDLDKVPKPIGDEVVLSMLKQFLEIDPAVRKNVGHLVYPLFPPVFLIIAPWTEKWDDQKKSNVL